MSLAKREHTINQLKNKQFDLLVIGGGINGAAAAWDASLRGLTVAVIDKGDFGAATSAGCFKIIHGGLRYLQHFDFRRLLESVQEQRLLRIIAPHLLKPLPFLVPCYKPLMKRKAVIRLALSIYEFLARARNSGVQRSLRLPNHQVLSTAQCLDIAPGLSRDGLEGGVLYYDVQMNNCERLTYGILQAAVEAGCVAANYVSLSKLSYATAACGKNEISSVQVIDSISGEQFSVKAKSYINATGPWMGSLAASLGFDVKPDNVFSKGIQLVVPELTSRCAFAVESSGVDSAAKVSRGARAYFIQPWNGYSLIGTSDELVEENPDSFDISQQDIKRFIDEVRSAYTSENLEEDSVLAVFGGLRPVADDVDISKAGEEAKVARKDLVIDHARVLFGNTHFTNLISMRGVKYTTFRLFAQQTVDLITKKLNMSCASITNKSRLSSTPSQPLPKFLEELQKKFPQLEVDYLIHLMNNYGRVAEDIAQLAISGLNSSLDSSSTVRTAELVYCARHEMVEHLDDLLLRRVPLCIAGVPDASTIEVCAELAANELQWSESRKIEEQSRFLKMLPKNCMPIASQEHPAREVSGKG